MTGNSELYKVLNLSVEFEFFTFQVKHCQSDCKDWDFLLTQAKQQFEDLENHFTDLKASELQDRVKLVSAQSQIGELRELVETLGKWRSCCQDFK